MLLHGTSPERYESDRVIWEFGPEESEAVRPGAPDERPVSLGQSKSAATTAPQATKMPPLVRQRIRNQLPADVARQFDELCAWEDEIVEALNIAAEAADRMAAALEAIEETPYGEFETKGDYAAFVRDLAHNGRWPK